MVSNQPTSDDVDFDWGHNPLMTPRNAIIALNAHSEGDITLDVQESGLISQCLSPLTSFVPYDYPGFWQSLHDFANQSGWSVIDADSGHEFGLDPLEDVSIMVESGLVSILPPALLPAHPLECSSDRIQPDLSLESDRPSTRVRTSEPEGHDSAFDRSIRASWGACHRSGPTGNRKFGGLSTSGCA